MKTSALLNDSLTGKNVTFTPNTDYVSDNYTSAFVKAGIGVLTVDLYVNIPSTDTYYVLATTSFRPSTPDSIHTVDSNGNKITAVLGTNGELSLVFSVAGVKNVRFQLITDGLTV